MNGFPFSLEGTIAPDITQAQADLLFTAEEQARGECRGQHHTSGPWGQFIKYRALCVEHRHYVGPDDRRPYGPNGRLSDEVTGLRIWGPRTLSAIRPAGYHLEGVVSINGRKFSAFTSSQLFRLPNGLLIDAAIIYPRIGEAIP